MAKAYTGLEATYHELFWSQEGEDLELELLQKALKKGDKHLEVGAGSGRHLIPLAQDGYDIVGIEPSTEMVKMAEEKISSLGLQTSIQLSDLEQYQAEEKFDAALFTSFTFQLFLETQSTLEKVSELLAPKGKVYFSCFIPWAEIVGELEEDNWYLDAEAKLDGPTKRARCWTKFQIDRLNLKLHRTHRYEISEKKKVQDQTKTEHTLRWFTVPEIELFLEKAGYKLLNVFGDFDYDDEASENSQVISILAEKNA